ncbi:MAG: carbamoyltransferase HypF [Candidatus Methanomethylophilaceae archaeon]|nr:carbamoyltransferase HypF [Candidatus Methanomethylophilaceae archaeon]
MRITIRGTVQGVGFRPAVYRAAMAAGASGGVWNEGSDVVIDTDGPDGLLDALMSDLPPLAHVDSVERIECPYTGPPGFAIRGSTDGGDGASIPADSAVCDRCVSEIMSPGRRHGYPFTTCTDCGPRYTLLRGMPYDRVRTSMDAFPPCPECGSEYSDPSDRRFHHQTVCCPSCGPRYTLLDGSGEVIGGDPIPTLARILDSGGIAVLKGWGGMHICCIPDRLGHLREWYGRREKPFALMVRDIDAVRRYADPTDSEVAELLSPRRPIVLLGKVPSGITELASPGLDNIGVFLPYTGMHHMLFSEMDCDALVMTSANVPGEPMVTDNVRALELGADAYLLHDQPILNRADDSVVRMLDDRTQFIRRSRGYVPFHIPTGMDGDAVALGAQENLTGAVASDSRIWPTQHIGNGERIGVPEYLEEAVRLQMDLVRCEPSVVAMDLHPGYSNRSIGRRIAEEHGAEMVEVQHHWAHAAALMTDNGVDGCVALTLDGTGHGDDGTAWGGEVLSADLDGYRRVAHLQGIPLLGSERALHDLRRLGFAVDTMNGVENHDFTDRDASVMSKLMGRSVTSSSFGRLLDTLSYKLGVCSERSYDGEPAMKLEPLLARGSLIDGFEARTVDGTVMTAELFSRIEPGMDPADVAYSVVYNVMGELVASAVGEADRSGLERIGITGGVSYNGTVSRMFRDMVLSSDHVPLLHRDVPNGDGGISVGQVAIALRRIA